MSTQRGVALVITLILLGALALGALSATQSSTLELAMSGNELYRLRALMAAEAAMAAAAAGLTAGAPGSVPAARSGVALAEQPDDHFDYTVRYVGPDTRLLELSGGARSGAHYSIAVVGRSLRGAQARVECGLRVVRDAGGNLLAVEREFWLRRDID